MTRKIRSFYNTVKRTFRPWRRRGAPLRRAALTPQQEIARLREANAHLIQTNADLIRDYDAQVAYARFLVAKAQELEYDAMLRRVELMGVLP